MWTERGHERPEVWDLINTIDRRDTPARKIERAAAARRTVISLMRAGVRHQHPDWTEDQVRIEVLRRILPADLFERTYGRCAPAS